MAEDKNTEQTAQGPDKGPDKAPDQVIEVDNLVTHYGERQILKGITLDVRENEIMVIMGGSGSGKSTLLRHLMALETHTSGTMKILGQDIDKLTAMEMFNLRKKLGVAFQGGALFSSMTVGENIMLPLYEHTDLDPTTMEIMARMKLEVVSLAGFENLMPAELSGGMVKRAAFARAIIMDPKILFCDEPSAGLDPVVASALDDLILDMRAAMGMTVVVAHIQDIDKLTAMEMFNLRKKLGVAFQGGALFSSMTVGENIMLPLYEHTDLDPTTMEIMARMKLEVVSLAGFENLMPAELSGGMVKRAAFARAIIMDPKILFCDEPSAGLDPVVASALDDLILDMRAAMGMTVVVVTHELESAFKIADRLTILDKGHILMIGTVDEVRKSKNERVQNLLNRMPEDDTIDPDEYLGRLTGEEIGGDAAL